MTVTVIEAYGARGYGPLDHLIGGEVEDLIGNAYANTKSAKRAARQAFDKNCDPRLKYTPVNLCLRLDTGDQVKVTA
jgi:hypothetical protein